VKITCKGPVAWGGMFFDELRKEASVVEAEIGRMN
jgi:hypothetical protein